jgi:hypothetical protein
LPRPQLADDPPDIPRDVRALANAIDPLLSPLSIGLSADKGPAGKVGHRYIATDENNTEYVDLGAGWVVKRVLGAGAVLNADLATDSVDARVIAAGAVTTAEILDGTILAGDLADGIITALKVAAGLKPSAGAGAAVEALRAIGNAAGQVVEGTDARLTDQRVPTDASVTAAKMAANAILQASMADNSVGTAELRNGEVTLAKAAADLLNNFLKLNSAGDRKVRWGSADMNGAMGGFGSVAVVNCTVPHGLGVSPQKVFGNMDTGVSGSDSTDIMLWSWQDSLWDATNFYIKMATRTGGGINFPGVNFQFTAIV